MLKYYKLLHHANHSNTLYSFFGHEVVIEYKGDIEKLIALNDITSCTCNFSAMESLKFDGIKWNRDIRKWNGGIYDKNPYILLSIILPNCPKYMKANDVTLNSTSI